MKQVEYLFKLATTHFLLIRVRQQPTFSASDVVQECTPAMIEHANVATTLFRAVIIAIKQEIVA